MNQSKIYVGNLSYNTSEEALRDFFSQYGNIEEIKLISDYQTGRSKGFGFITFSSDQEGEKALASNGLEFDGRKLNVNTAKESNRGGRSSDRRY
ncbi:MAG: RNA-binding protein [Gammaproteobacteria bacterium]|nr:RNA-binding protein [Gammaproteobacteria bacterium]